MMIQIITIIIIIICTTFYFLNKYVSFTGSERAFPARVPEQKPPCSCTVALITARFIQQARSPCQWAPLCTSASLWTSNTRALCLFSRTATHLNRQTPTTPHDNISSRTSVSHTLCCIIVRRQTLIVIWAPFRVSGRCPTDRRRVVVTESGRSLRARFSALLFLIQDQYSSMYLHCSLSLCRQKTYSCVPVSHI